MRRYLLIIYTVFITLSSNAQQDSTYINRLNASADNLSEQNTDSALTLAQKAYRLSVKSNYKAGKATALNNLAVCNDIKGSSTIAIKQFIEAITLFKELKDEVKIAQCYSQMGISYFFQYQYDNALIYYEKSIDIYTRLNNKKDLAGVLINQGLVYTYVNKLGKAEENYLKALTLYKETNTLSGLSPTYNSLAKIYYHKKQFQKAIEYYKQSEYYSLQSNNEYNLIPCYNSLALCYKDLKQYAEAKSYSEKSIAISKKIGALELEVYCHETFAGILHAMGDYKNAYTSYKQYADLKDTLFTSDKNEAIAEMQARFDVATNRQKVKEVELEKKINESVHSRQRFILLIIICVTFISLIFIFILFQNKKKINELLKQNLEQKEVMMSEVHHRVKNNLQMVSSILDLQARDLSDEKSLRIIEDSLNRINAISLIHQRLYQSDNIRGIKINTYIQELAHDMVKNFSGSGNQSISLNCKIDDLNMDVESAIPIGLITAELIINACKYAFKNSSNPHISITVLKQKEIIYLAVEDNGSGKENNENAGTSFGTKLIKSLARKLRAEITENSSANGTSVQLKITNFKLYAN